MAVKPEMLKEMSRMSIQQLRVLSKKAAEFAEDLGKDIPTYELALAAGIRDNSYKSVRDGWIPSYSGEVVLTLENGKKFRCIGHRNFGGTPYTAIPNGYIEFIPL